MDIENEKEKIEIIIVVEEIIGMIGGVIETKEKTEEVIEIMVMIEEIIEMIEIDKKDMRIVTTMKNKNKDHHNK